jgi:uncharacterized protein
MDMSQFTALESQVLWASFGACVVFGAVAQRTNFCTMGAISDIYNMGSWGRMRMWGMAVGVAMIGFALMAWAGWINPARTIYSAARVPWLSAVVGGGMFGLGMVLASGCGSKTLVRIGEGSLKSLVVFFVMGLGAYATMRGLTGLWKSSTVDQFGFELKGGNALPLWLSGSLGIDAASAGLGLGLLVGGALIAWAVADGRFRSSANSWLAGLGIGGTIAFMWWLIGDYGFVPEHPETLDSTYVGTANGGLQALSFTSPMARTLDYVILYDSSKRVTLGVVSVLGVVVGALAYALYNRSFRWEGFHGTQDTASHIIGAALMGVGGVTAGGCTVGQGLSGISTLAVTSMIAVAGIMLGAVLGLRLQMWLIMRA